MTGEGVRNLERERVAITMACKFTRSGNAVSMIVCTDGASERAELNDMSELKRAMHCRRWEICNKCGEHEVCLSKRSELIEQGN